MNNNDILRRVRYAFDISNPRMVDIFKLAGCSMTEPTLLKLLKKEEEDECIECSNPLMTFFLDGLIINLRGRRESGHVQTAAGTVLPLNNNAILKKLRIALNLKEEDMIAIMGLAGVTISKSELTALFRNSGHKHFKECGDQFLRNFLKGVTIRNRPGDVAAN